MSLVFSTNPRNATKVNKEKSLSQHTLPFIIKATITNSHQNLPMDEFSEGFLFHSAYSTPSKPFSSFTLQRFPIPYRHAFASFQTPLQFRLMDIVVFSRVVHFRGSTARTFEYISTKAFQF